MTVGKVFAGLAVFAATIASSTGDGSAQDAAARTAPTNLNLYGLPGLIDLPDATSLPDAEFAATVGGFDKTYRQTLTFQITPRLTGSFRYTILEDFFAGSPGANNENRYDRSFDLRFRVLDETRLRPAVAIGLRDLIGTGTLGGEYVVASKTLFDGVRVSGGLGWGRLGSTNPIGSTGTRPVGTRAQGGLPTVDRWFRGDYAAFGGVAWSPTDRLSLKAEYSPDAYATEEARGIFERDGPWNFGVDYKLRGGTQLSLYHLYGTTVGAQVTFQFNPKTLGSPGGLDPAPFPVTPRQPGSVADLGWAEDEARIAQAQAALRSFAAEDGLVIEAARIEPERVVVRYRNPTYGASAQSAGRLARILTRVMPASVETFELVPVTDGMPLSAVILTRSDVERLEHEAASDMLAQARFEEAPRPAPPADRGLYPRSGWSLLPYVDLSVFDPDSPVRGDAGLRLSGTFRPAPSLELSGAVSQRAIGSIADGDVSESNLPRVRTDAPIYAQQGETALDYLQAAYYARPARAVYSRLTFGYLETMYAGVSGELLWKPVESRLALGIEVNGIRRRGFDQLFELQDMTTVDPETGIAREIPDVNGHLSAYYDFGNGFHGQVDAGRYLAGDWGTTVSLAREFANGWRVGAYATFTDATADDFGEGSFDKGLKFTIPLSSLTGVPSRTRSTFNLQSLSRDGGARLSVDGRLHEKVRAYHEPDVAETWGRFWR